MASINGVPIIFMQKKSIWWKVKYHIGKMLFDLGWYISYYAFDDCIRDAEYGYCEDCDERVSEPRWQT